MDTGTAIQTDKNTGSLTIAQPKGLVYIYSDVFSCCLSISASSNAALTISSVSAPSSSCSHPHPQPYHSGPLTLSHYQSHPHRMID